MSDLSLGHRIAEAACAWRNAEDEEGAGSDEAMEAYDAFLCLCDIADSAERLARAYDARVRISVDLAREIGESEEPGDTPRKQRLRYAEYDAIVELDAARRAWRKEQGE